MIRFIINTRFSRQKSLRPAAGKKKLRTFYVDRKAIYKDRLVRVGVFTMITVQSGDSKYPQYAHEYEI